jgi:hypothetical protein
MNLNQIASALFFNTKLVYINPGGGYKQMFDITKVRDSLVAAILVPI